MLVVLLAWYHVPPLYMIRAGFEVVLWLAFPLLLMTLAATLTATLPRYVILLVCVLVSGLALLGLTETFRSPEVRVSSPGSRASPIPRRSSPSPAC